MHISLLIFFAGLSLSAAHPGALLSMLVSSTSEVEKVEGIGGHAHVLLLLALQFLIIPMGLSIIRTLLLPLRIIKNIILFPVKVIKFILLIPKKLIMLPLTIIMLPVTIIRHISHAVKKFFSPLTRLFNFVIHAAAFIVGVPVTVFSKNYLA